MEKPSASKTLAIAVGAGTTQVMCPQCRTVSNIGPNTFSLVCPSCNTLLQFNRPPSVFQR